eukprot:303622-Amphidinium_carterae.1
MGVFTYLPQEQTEGYLKLKARWVRQWRGTKWRCRIVAKEFKFLDPAREGLYTAGANPLTSRVLDVIASIHGYCHLIGDATNAYFHTEQNRQVVIEWLPETRERAESCGYSSDEYNMVLQKRSSMGSVTLLNAGCERSKAQPQLYKHCELKVLVELHQDDVHLIGCEESVQRLAHAIDERISMKWSRVLEHGSKMRFTFLKANRVLFSD